jgi:hypothetical protein
MTVKRSTRTRRDRWADWAVLGVLVVALLLGWGVKAVAEGQRTTYTDEDTGLTVRYPKQWLLGSDEKLALQVIDPDSGDYKTTYQVRVRPIDATGDLTPTLTVALNNVSMGRAPNSTAYRMLDTEQGSDIGGLPTMETTYVFVAESSDLFVQRMPVVVMGLDIAVPAGDQAFVYTLLAAQDSFEEAEKPFRKFVESAEYR